MGVYSAHRGRISFRQVVESDISVYKQVLQLACEIPHVQHPLIVRCLSLQGVMEYFITKNAISSPVSFL